MSVIKNSQLNVNRSLAFSNPRVKLGNSRFMMHTQKQGPVFSLRFWTVGETCSFPSGETSDPLMKVETPISFFNLMFRVPCACPVTISFFCFVFPVSGGDQSMHTDRAPLYNGLVSKANRMASAILNFFEVVVCFVF